MPLSARTGQMARARKANANESSRGVIGHERRPIRKVPFRDGYRRIELLHAYATLPIISDAMSETAHLARIVHKAADWRGPFHRARHLFPAAFRCVGATARCLALFIRPCFWHLSRVTSSAFA